MIKKIILCLCLLFVFSGCQGDRGWSPSVYDHSNKITVNNFKYEMILWGGPVTYSYYADNYTIEGNFIVVNRYVEDERFGDSSIIRDNRLMLPVGITVIKSRIK